MSQYDWDVYFIRMARFVGSKSKDRSKTLGVVVVDSDRIVRSMGYNGFPRGVDDDVDARHDRPAKYSWTVHAETNACLSAARIGVSLKGCTAYMESSPCKDCANDMIQCGIKEIVCCPMDPEVDQFAGDPNWGANRIEARERLVEAGVVVREVKVERSTVEV